MFNLFQSNRMSVLARTFCARNAAPGDPFVPLAVIVQNNELGRWLRRNLAAEQGIAANVKTQFLMDFLWDLQEEAPPQEESPFVPSRLVWRVMALLQDEKNLAPALRAYLGQPGDPKLRRYQLSDEIAKLFDRYLRLRPDWMLKWAESDTHHPAPRDLRWQPKLWRALLKGLGQQGQQHRAALRQALLQQLESGSHPLRNLPPRVSIIGFSSLPPPQLQILQALAKHIEVDLYVLNPCRHYWGDIASDKEQARRAMRELRENPAAASGADDHQEIGNPILASLGKQGREFLDALLDLPEAISEDRFEEHGDDTALGLVKNDIQEMTFGGESGLDAAPQPQPLPDRDSLQIHGCHSPLREVEVLHDELLRLMASREDLLPGDILVLAPDISRYEPFIHSVFGADEVPGESGADKLIPFSIARRPLTEESTLISGFLTLLQLPESRLSGPEAVELLDIPAIARRFGMTADDVQQHIIPWLQQTGARWELDGPSKAQRWQVPEERHNTWEFASDRLLAGFAMTDAALWEGVLPFETPPDKAPLIAGLCRFIERLGRFREELSQARPTREWQALLSGMLEDFFWAADDDENEELERLRELAREFAAVVQAGGCEEDLSCALLRHWMQEQLGAAEGRRSRLRYGVTQFANMNVMRCIPRRVICLLGLNDEDYPKQERQHSFDLMSPQNGGERKGDLSLREDERYQFLEALLCAEEVFYLSYVGRGARDNQERPPSVVVAEWLDYLQALFGEDVKPVEHSLQPFNRRYYQGDRLQSWQPLWREALTNPDQSTFDFCADELPEDPALACQRLEQLEKFFSHSGKCFLQQRLKVYFGDDGALELKDAESFSLDALENHQLADAALAHMAQGGSIEAWQERELVRGQALTGAAGQSQLRGSVERAKDLHGRLESYLKEEQTPRSGELHLADADLEYRLEEVYGSQHLYYRVGDLKPKFQLVPWLRHLALNADGHELPTVMVARDGTAHFKPLDPAQARDHLEALLKLHRQGLTRPLLLPPQASFDFYETYAETKNVDGACEAAAKAWEGGYWRSGEGSDPYWSRLFSLPEALADKKQRKAFQQRAQALWGPLKDAWGEGAP